MVEDGDRYEELRGVELVGTAEIIEDPDRMCELGVNVFERYQGPYTEEMKPVRRGHAQQAGRREDRTSTASCPGTTASWADATAPIASVPAMPARGGWRIAAMGEIVEFPSNGNTARATWPRRAGRGPRGRRDPGVVGPRARTSRTCATASPAAGFIALAPDLYHGELAEPRRARRGRLRLMNTMPIDRAEGHGRARSTTCAGHDAVQRRRRRRRRASAWAAAWR